MLRRDFLKAASASACLGLFPTVMRAQPGQPLVAARFGELPAGRDIHRVISAGPVADVFLLSLIPDKLLGLSTHSISAERKQYLSDTVARLPNTGRLAGRASTFPMEKILALNPDIIVDIGSTSESYISTAQRVFEQTGIPYVLISGRLESSARQLRTLGDLLGAPERGNRLADEAQAILSVAHTVRQRVANRPPVKIFFGRSADGLETGLSGSLHAEVIDMLGAHNVAAEAGKNMMARVSMEQLIQWDPDVIITQDANYFRRLKTDRRWENIKAVEQERTYLAPSAPFGWLDGPPGINRLLGILWAAHVFYPALLPRPDYRQAVIRYFALYYGHALTPAALDRLDDLDGRA